MNHKDILSMTQNTIQLATMVNSICQEKNMLH